MISHKHAAEMPMRIERNAAIVERLRSGKERMDVAREYGLNPSRISQLAMLAGLSKRTPGRKPANKRDDHG